MRSSCLQSHCCEEKRKQPVKKKAARKKESSGDWRRYGQSTRLARRWKACSQSVAWQGSLGDQIVLERSEPSPLPVVQRRLRRKCRFRGGQRPGLSRERVAGAVQELGTHAVEVPLALTRLRASPPCVIRHGSSGDRGLTTRQPLYGDITLCRRDVCSLLSRRHAFLE